MRALSTGSPDGRCWSGGDQTADCYATTSGIATLTGKLGYLLMPNVLAYVKGGVAWIYNDDHVDNIIDITGGTCAPVGSRHNSYNTAHTNFTSGTAGAGVEVMVTQDISVFGEYDWIGGKTSNLTMTNSSADGCVAAFPAIGHVGDSDMFRLGATDTSTKHVI
jgi:opacity protein-like surface antigen